MFSRFRSASAGGRAQEPAQPEPPIYLISMAGFPNFGDELIAARWLRFLAEHKPDTEVWLDVREPGTASSLFKGVHPKLHVTNTVFRAIHEHLHFGNCTPAQLVRDLGSPKFDVGLLELREAGVIHLLGGGFVNSVWQENKLIVDAMRATREISGARLIATGQGLMPRIDENFESFEHVSVRDNPSALALGIERGWDDAYLLPSAPQPGTFDPQTAELYLCIQNDALDDGAHENLVAFARRQVEHWGIPRERTFYVEAIPGDDFAGYDALRDLVGEFLPFAHFWRSGFEFSSKQVWLTTRFHHHLVGALHGARGIALSGKAGYYDVKHGSLADSGTGWILPENFERLYDISELQAPQSFAQQVRAKYAEAKRIYA